MTGPTLPSFELSLSQVFLDHSEFRHRGEPLERSPDDKGESPPAEVTVTLMIAEDQKSVAVRVQVSSDDRTGRYFYSVAYVAVFTVTTEADLGSDEFALVRDRILVSGATVAMPFARELIANLTGRGRHGPIWINPVNFAQIVLKKSQATPATTPSP